jgi:N,N'-diacetyllegionaminate synthase
MVTGRERRAPCRVIASVEGDRDTESMCAVLAEARTAGADGVKVTVGNQFSVQGGQLADWIDRLAREAGPLDLFVAPYDLAAVRSVSGLQFKAWKIDPPLITHLPLLEEVVKDERSVVAGIGGCTARELRDALEMFPNDTVLMHTVTFLSQSIDVRDVAHLAALRQYGRAVGYADAGNETAPALVAVALGASVIEKKLILDRRPEGIEREGLLPHELRSLVVRVRELEHVLAGNGARNPLADELDYIEEERVSIVASRAIHRGTALQRNMLKLGVRGHGLPPRFLTVVEGKRALYEIAEGTPVTFGLIEL